MVDVPQNIKKKKRIRSMFSPEQSKLIRSKALPASGSGKHVQKEKSVKEGVEEHNKKASSESEETYRFEVDLSCDRENDKYPEISFSRLVEAEENSEVEQSDEDQDVKRISQYFEQKYGGEGGRRRTTNVNIDHGYDTDDSFVDDSEAFDEVIPDELDTQHGGFYINFGDLMFKKVALSESDGETAAVENRKRKRDEEDRKQLHKKMKTQKIKDKYKKMDKEVKLKKRKIIVEDDSSDSDIQIVKPTKLKKQNSKELKNKNLEKKQNVKIKETTKTAKTADVKAKKSEKKPSAEKKVAKKKSKDIIEEERAKVLEIVEVNKPFGDDKLPLITENLASIEFELRRNHNNSRRAFYEDLIKRMGENSTLEYTKIKTLAFSALTKRHAAALEEALLPLKKSVSATLLEIQPGFEKRYAAYVEKLQSWKSAQAEQTPGEELVKPKAPPKSYRWDETTRALYGKVIQVKFSQLKLIRAKPDEQSDLMKRYMKTLAEEVWPGGWVTISVLQRESQPYCKLFAKGSKKKPAVSANTLKTTAKPAKLKSEKTKPAKTDTAKSKSELVKPKPDQQPKQNSTSKTSTTEQAANQDSATKTVAKSVAKSVASSDKISSNFDAAFSHSTNLGVSPSKTKPLKEPTQPSKHQTEQSSSPSHSLSTSKPTTKTNSSKPASTAKCKDQVDLAIIKSNINKINANLNRSVPSITITDRPNSTSTFNSTSTPSTSSTPFSSSSSSSSAAVAKLSSSKPPPKSAKTASDRPIVSVPAMSHLISPRSGPTVKLSNDHIPPDFINNLLLKYGAERLQQIKSQGLFPTLLKEELQQIKSNSNAVIIIDDDAASPKKAPPKQQAVTSSQSHVTSSQSNVTSSQSNVTSSQPHVTSSQSHVTSSQSHVTSSQSHVTSSALKSTTLKTIVTSPPKTVALNTSHSSENFNKSKSKLSLTNTVSVIEKSSKTTPSSFSTLLTSVNSTPNKQTIPVNISSPSRTMTETFSANNNANSANNSANSANNSANSASSSAMLLTNSRPSILITKSTLPSSAMRSHYSAPSVKPVLTSSVKPALASSAKPVLTPSVKPVQVNRQPATSNPGLSNSNLQNRLSQLMNNSAIIQASSHNSLNCRVPNVTSHTPSRDVTRSHVTSHTPSRDVTRSNVTSHTVTTPSVKPNTSNQAGISLGAILSQHPNIDSQTLNKSILKSVAAKLQSFKESKEKE